MKTWKGEIKKKVTKYERKEQHLIHVCRLLWSVERLEKYKYRSFQPAL